MKLEWQDISDDSMAHFWTFRAKVFGGWLVRTSEWSNDTDLVLQSEALVYVPDQFHEWVVDERP
jgi:hypothetical protein